VETDDIATQMPVHAVAVSPDASRLAVAQALEGSRTLIRVYPMQGGEGRTLAELDRPIFGTSLAFSADGTALYFSDRFNEGPDGWSMRPWIVQLDRGEPRALGLLPPMTTTIRPHPDGRRIATVTGMPGTEFWVMEDIAPVRPRSAARRQR
jgi:Tol biopolymer transport system component